MISTKLTDNIRRIFEEENRRIVFWNDGDRVFEDGIEPLDLPGIQIPPFIGPLLQFPEHLT